MKKLSTKKFVFIIVIIFILFIFQGVWNFIDFDRQASSEDMRSMGIERINEIKNHIIKNSFSPGIVKFNFMSGIGVFVPILIIIIGYDYNKIKNNHIKFNIGKNDKYFKELNKEKIQLALFNVGILVFIYIFIFIISLIFGEIGTNTIYGKNLINSTSILYYMCANEIGYAIFTISTVSIATFISSLLTFYLIDYFGFIKSAIIYLAYMWVGTVIIYNIINTLFIEYDIIAQILKNLAPMHSFMGITETSSSVITVLCSYISIIWPIIFLKLTRKYEVA